VPALDKTLEEISELVIRMAEENRKWGYQRIQGAMANLGHILAHTTIANILKRHGIEPAPRAQSENHVEGISGSTLGPNRRD